MAGELRWIFSNEELQNTPSRKAGIDAEKELNYRQQCANLVQDMGQKLQVTQLCINTAIVYMHRFYMFHSFTKFHRNPMGAACLFLAAKVEEQPRKLEHVIKAYHFCVNRDQGQLDVKSEAYLELAQECVINENILLQTLGFSISVEHPHAMVVKTCTLVKASKDLAQTSYFLATNSLHLTTMCLKYSHTVVACVCIHLACKWSNYQIPRSTEGKEWHEYVDKKITKKMLEDLTQEFLQILDNCPSKLKKKILTWKSGSKSVEEQNNPGGDPSKNKHNHLEPATNSPVHMAKHGQPSTSTVDQYSQPDPHQHRQTDTPEAGSGMRRVRTEPVLAHKEYVERKQRERERARLQHGQHKPGYHGQQGSGPTHPPPGAGGPTHPPPGSRPTHPPPSRRPPGAPHHPPPGHRGGEFARPHDEKAPHSVGQSDRRGIFDQMQHERHRSDQTQTHEQPANPHKSQSHAAQAPTAAAGAPWSKGQAVQGHSVDKAGQGHSHGHGYSQTAAGQGSASSKDKLQQGVNRQKLVEKVSEIAVAANRPPLERKVEKQSVSKTLSKTNQDNLEKTMLEKLQSEIQKQSAMGLTVKHKEQSHKRQSPEKAALRSPPPVKRQKSNSSGSKSGSDSTTPKDRIRAVQEIKEKMIQEDQKRLRRMSEELGDDRLLTKTVVVLDDVFISPESAEITPEKALLSPGAEFGFSSQAPSLHKTPPKDAIGLVKKEITPKDNQSVHELGAQKPSPQMQKDLSKEFNIKKERLSDGYGQPSSGGMAYDANKLHNPSIKREISSVHRTHHKDIKREITDSQKIQDASKMPSKEVKSGDFQNVHNSNKSYDSGKAHGAKHRTEHTRVHVKKEMTDSHKAGHPSVKKEHTDPGKSTPREVRKSQDLPRGQIGIKKESESPRKLPDSKKDVSEILKSIGRKEDFLRIGPPRDLPKKESTETSSDTVESVPPFAGGSEAKESATLVRNKSTISLEKYRERRPLTPSQNAGKLSPIPPVKTEKVSPVPPAKADKPSPVPAERTDVHEILGNNSVISKDSSIFKQESSSKQLDSILNPSELNDISNSSLVEFSIGSPPKSVHSDAKTLLKSKKEKIEKLMARIEKPPERSHQEVARTSPEACGIPVSRVPAVAAGFSSKSNSISMDVSMKEQDSVVMGKQVGALNSSPLVEPGEIIDDMLERPFDVDSPKKEKLGLKIKLGGQPVVVTSMSPASDVTGQAPMTSSHHHKEKHKHKHKHKSKRDKERGDRHERRHHRDGSHRHRPSATHGGESSTSTDLKMKLNIKHLKSSDSPHAGGEVVSVARGDGEPGMPGNSGAPMKLVLSKDESGQYSSGHKHRHSSSSRKRTHSPMESERIVAKVPRSDSPASGLGNANGSRPGSPSRSEYVEKARLERILQSQRKTLGKLKEKQASKNKNKSPVRLPAGYQNPNTDL